MAKKNTTTPQASTEQDIKTDAEPTPTSNAPKFTKGQILKSKWFSHRCDILKVLLSDDTEYTHSEVDTLLAQFMKGKVN